MHPCVVSRKKTVNGWPGDSAHKNFFCYAPFADMGVDGFMARGELEFSALGFIPRVSSARLESLACNFFGKKAKVDLLL